MKLRVFRVSEFDETMLKYILGQDKELSCKNFVLEGEEKWFVCFNKMHIYYIEIYDKLKIFARLFFFILNYCCSCFCNAYKLYFLMN